MKDKTKMLDVNLLEVMAEIVEKHTEHYKSDFYDCDTHMLREAALKPERVERLYIWLCRPGGTWLLRERDVFIQGTRENSTFCFYREQTKDDIWCYLIETGSLDGDAVIGDIYSLDYPDCYQRVKAAAVPAGNIIVAYEKGKRILPPTAHFGAYPDYELGKFVSYQFVPESQEQLEMVLRNERQSRERFKEVITAESK